MSKPLVSILIPTYNGERFLRPALRSALSQSHREIEVVIGDDGSTDGTWDLIAAAEAADPRVRGIRHPTNLGPFENPLTLLREARGEYVKFLLHDDVLATDCVRDLLRGFESAPGVSLAFSRRLLIDEDGRTRPDGDLPALRDRAGLIDGRELGDTVLQTCTNVIGELTTALFRKDDVDPDDAWLVDGRRVDVLNDVALWVKLLRRGPAYYTPQALSRFRIHGGQNTFSSAFIGRAERDWSRLVDWGARNGFLAGEGQEGHAQARALLLAANRVAQMSGTADQGAALEAAFLSVARLVELTRPATGAADAGLNERAHGRAVLDLMAQDLDVWTQEHPVAVAAPALTEPEVQATVQAFREVLAAGAAARVVLTVPAHQVEEAVPMVEAALAAGEDIPVELVPTDQPATLFRGKWLAVVPRGGTWHAPGAQAIWRFDVPGQDGSGAADA